MRDGVDVKYFATSSGARPIASKICAPQYDGMVEIPIFDITLSRPLPMPLIARARDSSSASISSIRYGLTAAAP